MTEYREYREMNISINTQRSEVVTQTDSQVENSQDSQESASFENQLRAFLSPSVGSTINEEELFAALLQERLQSSEGEETAQVFSERFQSHKSALTRGDGYVNVEEAANRALADLVSEGHITQESHNTIYQHSFMAAQLDDNHSALFDGRGGGEDQTIATGEIESALLAARSAIEALERGELPAGQSDSPSPAGEAGSGEVVTPKGNEMDGPEEFVFKPESDSDGKLVVILPQFMTGGVEDILLKDEDGNILERGRGTGVANGNREHFRFNKPGEQYPDNLTVEVRLSSGDIKSYTIPNPGERYD